MRRSTERPTSCCCGSLHCAYLEHNNAALEGLESLLENAARIGQVGAFASWGSCLILQINVKQSFQDPSGLVIRVSATWDQTFSKVPDKHVADLRNTGTARAP